MSSATDELRRLLDERGVKWGNVRDDGSESGHLTEWQLEGIQSYAVATEWSVGGGLSVETHRHCLTPEQAIAATLGSELPYDELLRCLENDWHISASWDGLRKFWCIELTEEGVKLRNSAHATLGNESDDAAMVRLHERMNAALLGYERAQGIEKRDGDGEVVVPFVAEMHRLIEEAATLGSGTCKVESMHGYTDARTHTSWCVELSCHTLDAWEDSIPPSYCPICGARVVE